MAHKIKLSLFNSLFRFFSFLSDKSKGNAFFVKYKVLLGSLVLGLSVSGCTKDEPPEIICYDTIPEVTCYRVGPMESVSAPDKNIEDDLIKIGE